MNRIESVSRQMKAAGLGAILVCPSEELLFLTGFSPMMCERFQGMFLKDDGSRFYVCNLLYRGEIANAYGKDLQIYAWMDGESMTDVVAKALRENGLESKTIGVNSTAQAFNVLDIMRDCGVVMVNALHVLEEARIIKTPQEVDDLRVAAKLADDAFAKVIGFIRPGMTEGEILQFLSDEMTAGGGTNCWGIIASGPNSSYPHYLGTDRVIQEKDMMILDFGCAYNGMCSDMSRTVFVGGITEEERKIYDIVLRAHLAAEAGAVNGAFIPDVDQAARGIIEQEGYGGTFINRVGHGIGYMIHEAPDIKKNNRRSLEPGMAFSIEPGIYIAGKMGMRIEDIVVVTETGNEVLNKASKEIIII